MPPPTPHSHFYVSHLQPPRNKHVHVRCPETFNVARNGAIGRMNHHPGWPSVDNWRVFYILASGVQKDTDNSHVQVTIGVYNNNIDNKSNVILKSDRGVRHPSSSIQTLFHFHLHFHRKATSLRYVHSLSTGPPRLHF